MLLMNMLLAFNFRAETLGAALTAVHKYWLMDPDSFLSGAIDVEEE